jgi:hypothetical protein
MVPKTHPTSQQLKTRGLSSHHIEIFEEILVSEKSNEALNIYFGYTQKSHCVVDHSRKVMHKLLGLEGLSKTELKERIAHPKLYKFWWKKILHKHRDKLIKLAVKAEYY